MRSPLFTGILYLALGIIFTIFAIQSVRDSGWGFFTYLLILLATMDFGSGLRFVMIHYQLKKKR
ncbi:uncharacterized protein DUF4305 [Bacillus oleivorans]|uniref:Uncharacterized protein DUF4305 n=1 Tax=Bacillus oleivorans TaxID=1448271 RepID=A0A285D7J2_9BACI|nr:YdiK family protein [Bacillus oleivorans]SNX75782.1 uncharacterized protein DUF4305 [Bacillus oleivorans]